MIGKEEEGKDMTREEILKEIDEVIKYNKAARGAEVTEIFKDATRKSNDVLAKTKRYIDGESEYERGLEDAWEMAGKLTRPYSDDSILKSKDTHDIYGCFWYEVFKKYTAHDALSIYKDWLKEKEEEAKKPVLGDVVEFTTPFLNGRGVYLRETDTTYNIFEADGSVILVQKEYHPEFKKTGEHVDILGVLKGE